MTYPNADGVENRRLETMSEHTDKVSLATIDSFRLNPDKSPLVLDIGSSAVTTLGKKLGAQGYVYIPTDIQPGAVIAQRQAGFTLARSANPDGQISIPDDSISLVHARFLFAWLNPGVRQKITEESLRVCGDVGRICLIDYDWNRVDGPPNFVDLVSAQAEFLARTPFDTKYGAGDHDDVIDYIVSSEGVDAGKVSKYTKEHELAFTVGASLREVRSTTLSLISKIGSIGDAETAEKLRNLLDIYEAGTDPYAVIKMPSIIASAITVRKRAKN